MDFCGVVNFLVVLFGQGPVITLVVQWLKRIPYVQQNPLAAVAILNALAAITTGFVWCGLDVSKILTQLIAGFSVSVATYEVGKAVFERPVREDLE